MMKDPGLTSVMGRLRTAEILMEPIPGVAEPMDYSQIDIDMSYEQPITFIAAVYDFTEHHARCAPLV